MKYSTLIVTIALISSMFSCTSDNKNTKETNNIPEDQVKVSYINMNDAKAKELQHKGAIIVKLAATKLGVALKSAIKENGVEAAIDFCNINAIKITDSLANAEGVTIKRVAKKNRNPINETNAVESKIFKQYVMEWLGGGTLKSKISINSEGHPVYYKPIILNSMCLTCHGVPGETMPANIADKIAELYPNDKAIDFKDKHPRGMWAITFNNISVNKK